MKLKEAMELSRLNSYLKQETKALKKAGPQVRKVVMRVVGIKAIIHYQGRGWKVVSAVPLGRGTAPTAYLMSKSRQELERDLA